MIGTYSLGWRELADFTKAERSRRGFPENEPLLQTGEFRDSISASIGHHEAFVGSDSWKAKIHEFGNSRVPARPLFGPLTIAARVVAKQSADRHVKAALAGRGASMHGLHEFRELLHLAKEVLHEARELAAGVGGEGGRR